MKTRVETGVESSVKTVDWSVDRTCDHVLSILESPTDTGLSPRNIRYCQDFSRLYFATPILPQVVAKSVDDKRRTSKMQHVVAKSNCPQAMGEEIIQQLVGNLVNVPWGTSNDSRSGISSGTSNDSRSGISSGTSSGLSKWLSQMAQSWPSQIYVKVGRQKDQS